MSTVDLLTSIEIPGNTMAPSRARRFLAEKSAAILHNGVLDDAMLLVSEVMANAVNHGGVGQGSPAHLAIRLSETVLWVGITQPLPFVPPPTAKSNGFGLQLIDALSSRWGDLDFHGGAMVWFELDRNNQRV